MPGHPVPSLTASPSEPPACLSLTRRHQLGVGLGGLLAVAGLAGKASGAAQAWPSATWPRRSPAAAGMDAERLRSAIAYAGSRGGSGFVARDGYYVASWGNIEKPYGLYSATKGFGSLLLGLAVDDRRVALSDRAQRWLPEVGTPPPSNVGRGWLDEITIDMLATHTAGFDDQGGFEPLLFGPGSRYAYSNCGPNWLADVLTVRFSEDLAQVLGRRVMGPIGIASSHWHWRKNIYRPQTLRGLMRREFGSGLYLSASAFARVGLLLLRKGMWRDQEVIPKSWIDQATRSNPALANTPNYSGGEPSLRNLNLLIQNNSTGIFPNLPRDSFMFRGKHTQHVVVVPSLGLVIVRLGERGWTSDRASIDKVFAGFIAAA